VEEVEQNESVKEQDKETVKKAEEKEIVKEIKTP